MAEIVINLDTEQPGFKPNPVKTTRGKSFTVEVIVPLGLGTPSFPICPPGMSHVLQKQSGGKSTNSFTYTFTTDSSGTLEAQAGSVKVGEGMESSGSGSGEEKSSSGSIEVSN